MKQGFKLLVDFRKDTRRELQVALRAKQGLVSHVDNQQRQTRVQIIAITIPPLQTVNGKRMAQIMEPWSASAATVVNSNLSKKPTERLIDRAGIDDGLGIAVAAEDYKQVRHHRCALVVVELDDVAFGELR